MIYRQVLAAGYLTHFGWGCEAGHHCGWATIEAESEAQAMMAVPALVRKMARVIPLKWHSPEAFESIH